MYGGYIDEPTVAITEATGFRALSFSAETRTTIVQACVTAAVN
jgi:hypothetical protein